MAITKIVTSSVPMHKEILCDSEQSELDKKECSLEGNIFANVIKMISTNETELVFRCNHRFKMSSFQQGLYGDNECLTCPTCAISNAKKLEKEPAQTSVCQNVMEKKLEKEANKTEAQVNSQLLPKLGPNIDVETLRQEQESKRIMANFYGAAYFPSDF